MVLSLIPSVVAFAMVENKCCEFFSSSAFNRRWSLVDIEEKNCSLIVNSHQNFRQTNPSQIDLQCEMNRMKMFGSSLGAVLEFF